MISKLTSRKLWVLVVVSLVMGVLNYLGTVSSDDLTNWFIFGYGAYAGTNVATKFAP